MIFRKRKVVWTIVMTTLIILLLQEEIYGQLALRSKSFDTSTIPAVSSLLSGLKARCIGPGGGPGNGRVTDIAVYEKNPEVFYIGSASGGVFKTVNGGKTTFVVFDKEGSSNIGAIAVGQTDSSLLWVGTGEAWHRNDAGRGDGIYKSVNGGRSWKNMGLPNSSSISKIIIHPHNDEIVYVAVLGSAWGYGPDRGIYKTINGGKTWRKVLFVNDKAGAADLAIDPKNPRNLLATIYEHRRLPYRYIYGGSSSGIYCSTDGGENWYKVTKGLPVDAGRISVSYYRKDPRYVAATVETSITSSGFYKSRDGGKTWDEMPAVHFGRDGKIDTNTASNWYRPYYNQLVRYDPEDVNRIYSGSPWHRTMDGGKTFYSKAGDNHALWINPANPNHIIMGDDGGVSQFRQIPEIDTITHRFKPNPIIEKVNLPPIGQCYGVGYDMRKPYWVMANMQDEDAWIVPTETIHGGVIQSHAESLENSGESGYSKADPSNPRTVYTGAGSGILNRIDLKTGSVKSIGKYVDINYSDPKTYDKYIKLPKRERAGWNNPFIISSHNNLTLYFGTNYLYKSVDRGDNWQIISDDLTHDNLQMQIPEVAYYGAENHSVKIWQTISTISESPMEQGILWVGTDDGYIHLTIDDGKHWTNLTKNIPDLPEYTWVSSISASRYSKGTAYVTFDGHRNNDNNTYVFVTEDYGKTWKKIKGNLPSNEACFVIKEGLKNPDLLFLGTEFSLYISMDRGITWTRYQSGDFPTVGIYEIEIHPRELDLIIGTHGRSIWTLPIRSLEELTVENRQQDVYFTKPGNMYLFPTIEVSGFDQLRGGISRNSQPGTLFSYYLRRDAHSEASLRITDASGKIIYREIKGPSKAGLNTVQWMNGRTWGFGGYQWQGRPVIQKEGDYRVVLKIDGKEYYQTLHVEDITESMRPGFSSDNSNELL